jgi:hypothetical protein
LKILAQYRIANNSVPGVKEERLRKTLNYYEEFLNTFPGSDRTEDAGKVYDKVMNDLSKINS